MPLSTGVPLPPRAPIDGWLTASDARLRAALSARVDDTLEPLRDAAAALRGERSSLELAQRGVRSKLQRLEADLAARTAPLTGATTVHQAWRRHPGVQAVFARRHLPACDGCAVGVDETLAEAALGHGFDLDELLAELRAVVSDQPGALAG